MPSGVRRWVGLAGVIGVLVGAAQSEECPAGASCNGDDLELLQLVGGAAKKDGEPDGSQQLPKTECPGFVKCLTEFPMPYKLDYPQSYPLGETLPFPKGFAWGVGTASYQIEGAYKEGGRGASIWDTFTGANTQGMPGSLCSRAPCPVNEAQGIKGATGNVANDHYHKFRQDVAMMASMGVPYYRFSMAWPRIFPTGHSKHGPNAEGVQFYHDLLDELAAHGIEPIVTMYHWDLPQGLLQYEWDTVIKPCDRAYKQGWFECEMGNVAYNGTETRGPKPTGLKSFVVKEFKAYAKLLLREYGSKVRLWATFNEAWTFTFLGSGGRGKAPNVQPWMDGNIWPYIAGHNVILAHAAIADMFNGMKQSGELGQSHRLSIVNNQDWQEPDADTPQAISAAEFAVEGQLGWYCDPIYGVNGVHDYPRSMRLTLQYLPYFAASEKELLKKNRPDAFFLNHYGTAFVGPNGVTTRNGLAQAKSTWLYQAGWGFRKMLNWVANRYGRDLDIWSTEGGWSDGSMSALEGRYDPGRTMYYYSYLQEMHNAIAIDGVNVKGYMAWSLMDNFEWERGYSERFGTVWNDFNFGTDHDSPGMANPIYFNGAGDSGKIGTDGTLCGTNCSGGASGVPSVKPSPTGAFGQTRHPKNTALWLQRVWESNALVDASRFLAATLGGDVCYGEGVYAPTGATCTLG